MSDKKKLGGGSIRGSICNQSRTYSDANDWAAKADVINVRQKSNESNFKKRNMTFDAGRDSQLEKKLAKSPIPKPTAHKPSPIEILKAIPGNNGKNDSDFTNCLLTGTNAKYKVKKEAESPI